MEQQLCVQVARQLPEQRLKVLIAPLERHIVHSNLPGKAKAQQHSGSRQYSRKQQPLQQQAACSPEQRTSLAPVGHGM